MTAPVIATEGVDTTGNTLSDLTLAVPSGTVNGELLIAVIASAGKAADNDTHASWTLINKTRINLDDVGSDVALSLFRRIAASEPADYAFTSPVDLSSAGMTGKMLRITGHDPTTPINAAGESAEDTDSTTAPSVLTTVANCLVVCVVATTSTSIQTATTPGTLTEEWDFGGDPGQASSQVGATKIQAAIGNTGAEAFTIAGSSVAQTIAIAPAPAGGTSALLAARL